MKVFGPLIQIYSLTPIVALQLFVSQGAYFNMEILLSTFLSQGTSTFGEGNMWPFLMKYFYLDFQRTEVCLGQVTGDFHEKEEGTLIRRGSSSIVPRLADEGHDDQQVSPWRLLILSCSRDSPRRITKLRNGIEAYFWGINKDLTGVRRNLRHVADRIGSIAVPSVTVIPLNPMLVD
jgi:hypothetical protein